jgi:hypothetical protein
VYAAGQIAKTKERVSVIGLDKTQRVVLQPYISWGCQRNSVVNRQTY